MKRQFKLSKGNNKRIKHITYRARRPKLGNPELRLRGEGFFPRKFEANRKFSELEKFRILERFPKENVVLRLLNAPEA